MKMTSDLDQWLSRPMSKTIEKGQNVEDKLSKIVRNLTIATTRPDSHCTKFRLPPILASDNNATWLATRKNANIEATANKTGTLPVKSDNDNSKWLARPDKVETDLVCLTGSEAKSCNNPWLASSIMTTSSSSLPGGSHSAKSFILPSQFSSNLNEDIWLCKDRQLHKVQDVKSDLDGWLFVPSNENCDSKNFFENWEEKSMAYTWISSETKGQASNDDKIQAWLKKALEEDFDDDDEDIEDLDDSSIEIITNAS
jgi:hypothetical protein